MLYFYINAVYPDLDYPANASPCIHYPQYAPHFGVNIGGYHAYHVEYHGGSHDYGYHNVALNYPPD